MLPGIYDFECFFGLEPAAFEMECSAAGTDKNSGLVAGSWKKHLAAGRRRNFETINRKSEKSCPAELDPPADQCR